MNTRCGQPDQLRDLVVTHTRWIRASVHARSINNTSLPASTTTIPNGIYPDYYYYYYYSFRFIAVALVTLARFPRWLAL